MTLPRPDRSELLIYRAVRGPAETAAAHAMLAQVKGAGLRRLLFSTERFEGDGKVKIQNPDAGYGTDMAEWHNVLALAFGRDVRAGPAQDGHDLLCLRQLLARDNLDAIVLMRAPADFRDRLQRWLDEAPDMPFLHLGPDGAADQVTAFRMDHPKRHLMVDLAIDLLLGGAVFGLERQGLDALLQAAWATARRL